MVRWTQTRRVILSCKVLTVQQGQQTSTLLALVKGCLSQAELGGGVFPLKISQSFTEVPEQASGWRGLRAHMGTWHTTGRGATEEGRKKETFQEDASILQKNCRS